MEVVPWNQAGSLSQSQENLLGNFLDWASRHAD